MDIILASKSPQRKQVLEKHGYAFIVDASNADEESIDAKDIKDKVIRTAKLKAETVAKRHDDAIILAVDTVVYFNGLEIGQQKSADAALRTLKSLLGKTHEVYSGIYIIRTKNGRAIKTLCDSDISRVLLKNVSDETLDEYVHSGHYKGKAGAYSVSDPKFDSFIEKIDGSYSNVMGMPIEKVDPMIKIMEEYKKALR
jgi:septum formation protein